MVVVWADLAPAFAFSATPLSGYPNFTAFSSTDSSQIDAIQRALVKLYNGSATARALIDQGCGLTTDATGVSSFTKQITIYKCPDPKNSFANANIISINADIVNNLVWIGVDGELHKEVLEDTVIHELVHAITGRRDFTDVTRSVAYDDASYNFPGPTQYVANQVLMELGYPSGFRQAGYLAALTLGRLCDSAFHIPKETSLAAQSCFAMELTANALTSTFSEIHFLISATVSTELRLIPTSRAIRIFWLSPIQGIIRSMET